MLINLLICGLKRVLKMFKNQLRNSIQNPLTGNSFFFLIIINCFYSCANLPSLYLCGAMKNLQRSSRPVAIWLLVGVAMIIVQIILGGITRLTGSGLSITEWKPILGAVPPIGEAQW